MKTVVHPTFLMVLFALSLVITAFPLSAQVYKVVDKDGNVTYTDQVPMDGSPPIELAPISVIEAPVYEKAPAPTGDDAAVEDEKEPSLASLRRSYSDFAIVAPQQEESVWRPDGPIPVAWTTGTALREGMQVTLYLDGKRYSSTTQPMIALTGLERGEHTVRADLTDSRNRVVAKAGTVTFFVRQPGLYNRAINTPNGGG
jgi:hypothetical protein